MLTLTIHRVSNEPEYREAMRRIDILLEQDSPPGTESFDELELLTNLVYLFEKKYYPISKPDPIETIKMIMEDRGLKAKDLEPYIGPKSRVSEILNRKRYFTLEQINNLHKAFKIPLNVFINDKAMQLI